MTRSHYLPLESLLKVSESLKLQFKQSQHQTNSKRNAEKNFVNETTQNVQFRKFRICAVVVLVQVILFFSWTEQADEFIDG